MSQKSSVPQAVSFVSQVLKRDTSAAQFRQDQATGDCTPSNETEDDADKKADLRPHDPPDAFTCRSV